MHIDIIQDKHNIQTDPNAKNPKIPSLNIKKVHFL